MEVIKGLLGGVVKKAVGLPLEGGQVVELWGPLGLVLTGDGLDHGGLAQAGGPQLFRVRLGIEFTAGGPEALCVQLHGVEFFLFKMLNRRLPLRQQRERGGQHPAYVQSLAFIQSGKQPGPVDADEPVCLGAAEGGGVEVIVLLAVCQIVKTLADGGFLHRGNPQPLDRLCALAEVIGQPENQFALPSCVGGADHRIHIASTHKLAKNVKLLLGVRQYLEPPRAGDNGQICVIPLGVFGVVCVSRGQLYQMTYAPAYQPAAALHIAVLPALGTQHLSDVHGN